MNYETNQILDGFICKIVCSLDLYTIEDWNNCDLYNAHNFIMKMVSPLCGRELIGIPEQWTLIVKARLIKHLTRRSM